MNYTTRVLISVLADGHGELSCASLVPAFTAVLERAKACKVNRPAGGFSAFASEELAVLETREPVEKKLVLYALTRHSTRTGVIGEFTAALAFVSAGNQAESLTQAITNTFKKIAAKKEKTSRAAALGYPDVSDDDDDE